MQTTIKPGMKYLMKTLLAAALGGGIAMAAAAATTDDHASQRAERMAKMQAERTALFQQADANHDGKLSPAEFATFKQLKQQARQLHKQEFEKNRFARLDTNKDGQVSEDELKAAQAKRAAFKQHHQMQDQAPAASM